jgi:hypothetical protein
MKSVFLVNGSTTVLMSLKSTLDVSCFKVETATEHQQALNKINGGLKSDLRYTPILVLTTDCQQEKCDEPGSLEPQAGSSSKWCRAPGQERRVRDEPARQHADRR